MKEIDVRGFSCPIPVVKVKKALDEVSGKPLTVLLDAAVALENVTRLAESRKCRVELETLATGEYKLVIRPQ